jgi:beta-lactamase class A
MTAMRPTSCWNRNLAAGILTAALAGCQSPPPVAQPAPATTTPPQPTTLAQVVEQQLSTFKARTGVYVKDLGSGEEAGVRADQAFNSLSVIKLAILVRAFQLSDAKQLNLEERVEVRRSDLRGGSGLLYAFDPGLRITLRDLLTQMIVTSDNTPTDMMLERVGGLDTLNAWLKEVGYANTRMVQTTLDLFRQLLTPHDPAFETLTAEDVFAYWTTPNVISPHWSALQNARGAELQKRAPLGAVLEKALPLLDDDNPDLWLGSMTARETARMLEALEGGRLASAESTRQMMAMLAEQRAGQLRLPHYLPWPDYVALHKTGDGPPVIANDVGIILGPANQKVIIAFFSAAIAEPYAEHEDRIGRLARAVIDHLAAKSGR